MQPRVFISYAWKDNQLGGKDSKGDVTKICDELHNILQAEIPRSTLFIDYGEMRNDDMRKRITHDFSATILCQGHHPKRWKIAPIPIHNIRHSKEKRIQFWEKTHTDNVDDFLV